MWIKCNVGGDNFYDPYILNLNTGARIYVQLYERDVHGDLSYRVVYDIPKLDDLIVLKSAIIHESWIEDEYNAPLSDEIDKIFELIKKGEDFEFIY